MKNYSFFDLSYEYHSCKFEIARRIEQGLLTLEEVKARLLKKERPLLEQGPVEN